MIRVGDGLSTIFTSKPPLAQLRLAVDIADVIARGRVWKVLRVIRDERRAIALVEHGQPGVELLRRRCLARLCRRPRALDGHRRGALLAADPRDKGNSESFRTHPVAR